MADDIVTRLRAVPTRGNGMCCGSNSTVPNPYYNRCQEAADEIERLREIIQDIANAVTDEGIKPGYHKQQVNYVRTMWNPLWQAISKAVKEMENGTSK